MVLPINCSMAGMAVPYDADFDAELVGPVRDLAKTYATRVELNATDFGAHCDLSALAGAGCDARPDQCQPPLTLEVV